MRFTQAKEPETKTQVLSRSLDLYRHAFRHCFLLALFLSFIAFSPRLIIGFIGQDPLESLPDYTPERLWLILINFMVIVFFTALLWRVRCVMKHQHDSLIEDFKVAIRKIIFIIVADALQSVLILLIFFSSLFAVYVFVFQRGIYTITTDLSTLVFTAVLFLIHVMLVFFIFFLFYFYLPLIVVEDKGILSSLKKSASLVWNHLGKTIWVQMMPWLIYLIVLMVIKFIFRIDIHIYFTGPTQPSILTTLLHLILFALFIPWVACVMLVQLHDLELRAVVK